MTSDTLITEHTATEETTETTQASESEASQETSTKETVFEEDPNAEKDDVKIFDEEKGLYFGKYKDESEAYKAFKNLESENGKLRREKTPEAPEEYKFDFSEDEDLQGQINDIDFENDPVAKSVTEAFKEHGVSQEAANDIIKRYLQAEVAQNPDLEAERKKLGESGDEMIKEVSAFVHKNLNEEEQSIVSQLGATAEGVRVLHKLTKMSNNIPGESDSSSGDPQELKDMAYKIKQQHGGNLYGESERRYEELMNKAISIELSQKR